SGSVRHRLLLRGPDARNIDVAGIGRVERDGWVRGDRERARIRAADVDRINRITGRADFRVKGMRILPVRLRLAIVRWIIVPTRLDPPHLEVVVAQCQTGGSLVPHDEPASIAAGFQSRDPRARRASADALRRAETPRSDPVIRVSPARR